MLLSLSSPQETNLSIALKIISQNLTFFKSIYGNNRRIGNNMNKIEGHGNNNSYMYIILQQFFYLITRR